MPQFSGFNMVATMGAITFTCLNSADVNMSADIYTSACAGVTWKARVAGANEAMFTLNYTLDSAAGTPVSGLIPGTTGTFTMSTNGTWPPTYDAAAVVESNNQSIPVEGISQGTITIGVNGVMTVT